MLSQRALYDKERLHGCANGWRGISAAIHCEYAERHPPIPPKQRFRSVSSIPVAPPNTTPIREFADGKGPTGRGNGWRRGPGPIRAELYPLVANIQSGRGCGEISNG